MFAIRNRAQFEQRGREVQNPASPLYHKWLTPQQAHVLFGESAEDYRAVRDWILSQGFHIVQETYGTAIDSIKFDGTVAQAEHAFRVTLVSLGDDKFANTSDPLIPVRFAGIIGSLQGLDNLGAVSPAATIGGSTAFGPDDVYTFYGESALLDSGINGGGTDCIAVVALSDFSDSAVNLFDSTFGLPAPSPNPIPRVLGDVHNPGPLAGFETTRQGLSRTAG